MTRAYAHQPEKDIPNLSMVSKNTQIWLCQVRVWLGGVQWMYFYGESKTILMLLGGVQWMYFYGESKTILMLLGGVQRKYFYGESRKTILREGAIQPSGQNIE